MAQPKQNTPVDQVLGLLTEQGTEGLAEAPRILLNAAMLFERERFLGAAPYERTPDRRDYANGFKPKRFRTRVGELDLSIPQVRNSDFYPQSLERGTRSERPLSEMVYLQSDARYEKVREGGIVIDEALLQAIGIDREGRRHLLGVSVSRSEAEAHWRVFLQSLAGRGLCGAQLITSDDQAGLEAARKAIFAGAAWQRCQFHLQQNASQYVSRQEQRKEVACELRAVFNAPSRGEADRSLEAIACSKQRSTSTARVRRD